MADETEAVTEAEEVATNARAAADSAKADADAAPDDEDLAKLAADAETLAVDAEQVFADAKAKAEADIAAAEAEVSGTFTAIRDFNARFEHQVLTFVKDQEIDKRVGSALRKLGAPIKFVEQEVEKAVKAVKGKV